MAEKVYKVKRETNFLISSLIINMGLDKIFESKAAATKKDMESGNNSDEDVNNGRRKFLVDAVKLVGAAAVVGGMPDVSLAESVKSKNVVENNHEKVVNIFNRTIEMLGMAGQFVLEGKRINLSVIKSSLEALGTNYGEKYSDYGDLLYKVATEYLEFSVDQASEMIGNSESILKAIDEGRTFFEEHVNNLENLKIGHIISFDKVIEMARLYSLSNKRGGAKSEYGVGFTKSIDNNPDKMVQITESSQGTEEMVMLNIANELGADADEYEKYSLHTHPNEFSFFSIEGDLTYYLSKVEKAESLRNFIPMMVDRSGIVWRMKFNKMTDEQLLDLKRQDKLILDFLNTYAIELEAISGMNMTSDKQSMLSVEFVDALSKLVKFKISGMLANPLTDKLGRCVKDLKIIREETKGLRELNEVAFNVDNHSKEKDFVDGVREITQVFGKYGIEVYPDIPGRVQKMWKDK